MLWINESLFRRLSHICEKNEKLLKLHLIVDKRLFLSFVKEKVIIG